MRTIHKFPVRLGGPSAIQLPITARVVSFAEQNGGLFIWAELDTSEPRASREFIIVGTGHPIPADAAHRGTCAQAPFIWHLYERGNNGN